MWNSDLHNIINRIYRVRVHYWGIYSQSEEPFVTKHLPLNHFAILNDQSYEQEGRHWFLLYRKHPSAYYVFDSLGFSWKKKSLYLKSLPRKFIHTFNIVAVQPQKSKLCGLYCLAFAEKIITVQDFQKAFSSLFCRYNRNYLSPKENNDNFVTRYCTYKYALNTKVNCA